MLRRCQPHDIEPLFAWFRSFYRYNPRLVERDYFEWQFRGGAFAEDEDYHLWLEEDQAQIMAFMGCVPVEFRYAGKIMRGCWPQNWAAPSGGYSGMTVLSHLTGMYDNLFYVGLAQKTTDIFHVLNIPILNRMPRWLGVVQVDPWRELFHMNSPQDLERLQQSREKLLSCEKQVPASQVKSCGRFDDQQDFLLDHWPVIMGYPRRTGKYLNWRYLDIPRHNYRALQSDHGQFAIYRHEPIKDYPWAVTRILEWSFSGRAAQEALAILIAEALPENVILIDFFCTATVVGVELEKWGFIHEDRLTTDIPYLFRPIRHAAGISVAIDLPPHRKERNLDFNQWYITKGDSDMDRIKL